MPPGHTPSHDWLCTISNSAQSSGLSACRDFLGSICGTGIDRGKVGDIIILGETGAQILVAAELVEHFERSLTQVKACKSSQKCAMSQATFHSILHAAITGCCALENVRVT